MFQPWVGKILWRREWQPTPVFLPGDLHGWRRLEGYSPWGCKESDTTERLSQFTSLVTRSDAQASVIPLCSLWGSGGGAPQVFQPSVPRQESLLWGPFFSSFLSLREPFLFLPSCLPPLLVFKILFQAFLPAWRLDMQISAPVLHEGLTLGRAATQDGCVVAAFNHQKQPKP